MVIKMENIVIVGSGAGGASVARELSKAKENVTIIEKGPSVKSKKAYQCYENSNVGVELLRTSCVGGATMVTAGNAVRTCQHTLKKLGVDIEKELEEVEKDLNVSALPDSHFGEGTRKVMDAAESLGFEVQKMPKFIDPKLCKPCGKCAFGCPNDAKWTGSKYIEEAEENGAKVVNSTPVTDLMVQNGRITGVKSGEKEFPADKVILSSGAIETPKLLQKAGLNAGENLFVDTFVTVGGMLKGINFNKEVQMNALLKHGDVVLAPHFSEILVDKLQGYGVKTEDILGIMVKIKDEASGTVIGDSVTKYSTAHDVELLAEGSAIAGSILTEAGVDPKTLTSTRARGAHPGGTAAIGRVVDKNLETEISGLFVADASVFPQAPGAPPVLTIVALAKRLGKYLVQD